MVVADFPVLPGIRRPGATESPSGEKRPWYHLKEFLKVVVEDDEHCQSEVGGRSKHFLGHLMVVIVQLFQYDGDSLHGDRLLTIKRTSISCQFFFSSFLLVGMKTSYFW